jgi:cell wall-associated NlpC family hydrolase
MTPYFDTPEKIATLDAEARSWAGTPFVGHAMVKGAGVDCVHLVAGIYITAGVLTEFDPGRYSLDEGSHLAVSKVLAWLRGQPQFVPVGKFPFAEADLQPGDAVCFRMARTEHHVGLVLTGDDIIHALPGRVVTVSNLRESFYRSHITAVFRPQLDAGMKGINR